MNRRWRGTALGASIVVLLLVAGEPRSNVTYLLAASPRDAVAVSAVGPIGMTVSNMEHALEFYTRVLPFEKVSEVELAGREFELLVGVFGARARTATLQLGQERLALTEFLAPRGRPIPNDFRPNDAAFQHVAIIVSDMAQAYARLRSCGVAHGSPGPQRLPEWNRNAGGIEAFYFRDPDGHFLEILHFPPGKGTERWQQKGPLFLGIDHTAIVSGDTDRSLALYRDLFGMQVAGESENFDTEQEHLNNVFGARLRITALRAQAGPGIELLEYLAPRTGRPAPADLASNDISHWQTTLVANRLGPLTMLARQHLFTLVSPSVVTSRVPALGSSMLIRDPDGHALSLTSAQ